MNNYIVRQAIKDLQTDEIVGYEFLIQEDQGSLYNPSADSVAANTMVAFLSENSDRIFKDRKTFMTFTPTLLFRNTPKIFDKDKVVIQIGDNIIIHALAGILISKYRDEGYSFAINDFQFTPKYFSILEHADYIKMDISNKMDEEQMRSVSNVVDMAHGFQKKFIATGVNSREVYDCALKLEVDYVEGNYISDRMTAKTGKMDFMQGNLYQLIVEITKDEPDIGQLEEIITRDASLTYALLKMANSPYFAVHQETTSVRQALIRVGINQLKQWIYLLSFEDKQENSSEEVLKTSFMRANFASALVKKLRQFPINSSDAYLMGMFSTLEYMIDASIEDILFEIPIVEEVKNALVSKEGPAGKLYELILCYENAQWAQIYMDSVEEVNNIWDNVVGMNSGES